MNGTGLRPWLRRERQPARRGFESALSELFGDFFETSDAGTVPLMTRGQWVPSLDVTDNVETVLVAAELPGMSKDDVTISFADSTLTLEGE